MDRATVLLKCFQMVFITTTEICKENESRRDLVLPPARHLVLTSTQIIRRGCYQFLARIVLAKWSVTTLSESAMSFLLFFSFLF